MQSWLEREFVHAEWQRSHCGAMSVDLAEKPNSEVCWKSAMILWKDVHGVVYHQIHSAKKLSKGDVEES